MAAISSSLTSQQFKLPAYVYYILRLVAYKTCHARASVFHMTYDPKQPAAYSLVESLKAFIDQEK